MEKTTLKIPNIIKYFGDKIFPSVKQSRTWGAILMLTGGQAVWSKRDFATLSREGFKNCMTVYACVSLIAKSAAGISWKLETTSRTQNERVREIDNHPLINMFRRPNPHEGQSAFMERLVSFYKIAGNSYIERVGPERGAPKELYCLRPDRVKILPGDTMGIVKGYEYSSGAKKETFLDGEILHFKGFHPLDDWYGLSPIEVAARGIDISNMAMTWNYRLLQNDARPAGALVAEKALDEEQREALKESIRTEYGGFENAGRPILLEAGMDWKQFSLSPKDMDWLNSDKTNTRKICTVFNVDPSLIGDTEQKTYANYQEGRKALYMENILPLMDFLRDEFNNWLTPLYGPNLKLDYNRDDIEAIKDERDSVYTRMGTAWWLTPNERRVETGYPEGAQPELNSIWIPIGLVPISELGTGAVDKDGKKSRDKPSFWQNKARKKSLWLHFLKRVEIKERRLYDPVKKYLKKQALSVKKAISRADSLSTIDVNKIFSVEEEAKIYAKEFITYYLTAFEEAGGAGIAASKGELIDLESKLDPIEGEITFSITPELRRALEELILESGAHIAKTTLVKIERMVEKAIVEGWTVEELTQSLHSRLDGLAFSRSRRIANTEMGKVENYGQLEGYKQSELVELKGWLSAFLKTTRDSHAQADAEYSEEPIGLNEPFEVGGELLQYPGDPAGSPGNIIECKCATYPEVKEF